MVSSMTANSNDDSPKSERKQAQARNRPNHMTKSFTYSLDVISELESESKSFPSKVELSQLEDVGRRFDATQDTETNADLIEETSDNVPLSMMDGPPAQVEAHQSSDRIPAEDQNTSSNHDLAEDPKSNTTELPEEAEGKIFMNMVDTSNDSRAEYLAEEATDSISKTLPDDSPDSQAELSHMMHTGWSTSPDSIPIDAKEESYTTELGKEAKGSISKTLPDDSPDSQAELSHMMHTGWSTSLDSIPIDAKDRNYTTELAEEAKGRMPRTLAGDSPDSEVGNPYLVKTGCNLDSLPFDAAEEGDSNRDFEEEENYNVTMIMMDGSLRSPVPKKNVIVSNNAQ
jgi:hypothetical protein